jgi:hypothetical protein
MKTVPRSNGQELEIHKVCEVCQQKFLELASYVQARYALGSYRPLCIRCDAASQAPSCIRVVGQTANTEAQ